METTDQNTTTSIKYNYWAYILTYLAIATAGIYFARSGTDPEVSSLNVISALALRFVFVSLAWIVGKRYGLNYVWLCLLGGLGLGLPSLLQEVFFYLSLDSLEVAPFLILGVLFMGIAILVISYPFQVILSKLR